MPKGAYNKFNIEQVRKIFEDKNCKLLSTEYFGSHTFKLKYQCKCGIVSEASLINFKKSTGKCHSCVNRERWADPSYKIETSKAIGEALQLKFQDKEYTDKLYATRKTETYKQNMKRATEKKWTEEDYVEKVRLGWRKVLAIKPNKPEKILFGLLDSIFPKEYKFVGDYAFWIENFNPDFINCNGQKKIVEMFGDYWHGKSQIKDAKRLYTYKKYGYTTLVIWEKELDNLDKVKEKLIEFHNGVAL